jgi:hypothetical protein
MFSLLLVNICRSESLVWHTGVVVLRSTEILRGELAMHPAQDIVLFRQGEQVSVYPAHKIQSVYYYDVSADINRKFIVIQQSSAAFSVHHLFEVVLLGEINVIRRVVSSTADLTDDAKGYHYYLQSGSDLIVLHKFQSKLYPRLLRESGTLSDYIGENNLNPNLPADVIRIVAYYNRTRNANQVTAALQL